jgi:hypothetical protein
MSKRCIKATIRGTTREYWQPSKRLAEDLGLSLDDELVFRIEIEVYVLASALDLMQVYEVTHLVAA